MTSSDAVTSVFHDSLYSSNLLVKRIEIILNCGLSLNYDAVTNYYTVCIKCSIALRVRVSAAAGVMLVL